MEREKKVFNKNKKEILLIEEISREKISNCMQCGKCSAGCPATDGMDILPHQIIRYLQMGDLESVKESKTIWTCASCFNCASRCPRNVDLCKLMEAVRLTIIRKKDENRLKVEDIPKLMTDKKIPQQAFMSAFRKYSK
ncbi:4Fe-4S dicluster domain-containing protein [Fusobacterium sp.]|uniref:4Fe-4S dicluster domain-containing protein n=1 Tax=Fusobacterium sp. TaxID=68766 RepID=UPI0025C62928|nr:4Fe-4S dicluster domain-containing protein [Fusobacterium sp.]